jgi:peptide/nickel transport system substrate-binding protein
MPTRSRTARALLALVLATAASAGLAQKRGGDIVMAQQAQPPSLDAMTTTAQATRNIGMHIFETLVTRDENGNVINDLASKVDASPDGRIYTFTLREGVKFHNGKEMTSADVKASLERYGRVGASPTLKEVESITAPGKYQVVVTLKKATPSFIDMLSSPRAPAVIIPAEEAGKDAGKIEIIGTGPFQFVEYKPDSHVRLKRFDGYVPNGNFQKPDGFSGRKTVYVDTATIRFVPEGGARVAGLQSGEFHVLEQMPTDAAKRAGTSGPVRAYQAMPWAFQLLIFNAALAPTNNLKVRQAMQVGLDYEEIMAISTDGSYRMTHGWQHPGTPYHAGDLGKDRYNVNNVERARALVKESGYKGEELVIWTDSQFKNHRDVAVTAAEQLKKLGINATVKVTDWPSALAGTAKPEGWNAWPLMFGIEPYEGPYNTASFWWGEKARIQVNDPAIDAAYLKLTGSPALADRQKAFADFQKQMFDQAYVIKLGDVGIYQATRANVRGYRPYRIPRMWDVWFE